MSHKETVRDVSNSARSNSSTTAVLEWDPSADVGTQVSNIPANDSNNEGLNGLGQMSHASNYGLNRDVVESKSRQWSSLEELDNDDDSDSSNSSYKTATETEPIDRQDFPQTSNNNDASTSLSNSECRTSPHEFQLMDRRKCGMTVKGTKLQTQGTQSGNNNEDDDKRKCEGVSDSSSTDLTPTCLLIDKLLRDDNVCLKNYGYQALEEHRQNLIRKMREELNYLEKLNKMLLDKRKRGTTSSSTTTTSALTNSSSEHSEIDHNSNFSSTSGQFEETTVKHTLIYTQKKCRHSDKANNKDASSHEEHQDQQPQNKKPVSYFVPFLPYPNYHVPTCQKHQMLVECTETSNNGQRLISKLEKTVNDHGGYSYGDEVEHDKIQINLQQVFQQYCPHVLANFQERQKILNNLRQERVCRAEIKREYFSTRNNCSSPNESLNNALPPKEPRVMSTKQMKELTEMKLKNLPEVREKLLKRRVEEDKKTYRVMSQVFSRKLRQNVLKGDVNIVLTKSLIRH